MTIPTTVPGLLRAAADEITSRGWWQHDYLGDDGEVCVVGALRAAVGAHPLEEPACPLVAAARDALTLRLPLPADGGTPALSPDRLPAWNDDDGRAAIEVLALLEATAAELEGYPVGGGALVCSPIPSGLTPENCPHDYSSDGVAPPPGQTGQWWHCNVCGTDYPDAEAAR